MWREGERMRIRAIVAGHRQEMQRDELWAGDGLQMRGQQYTWGAEEAIRVHSNVSSGAAAVIEQRRDPSGSQPTTCNTSQQTQGSKRRRAGSSTDGAPSGHDQHVEDTAGGAGTQRSGDTLLVYTAITFRRLEEQLKTTYYWRREPFGDG